LDQPASRPLVIGYYGMENVGDNAFCVVLNWALSHYWGSDKPIFAAPPMVDLPADQTGLDPKWYRSRSPRDRAGWVLNKANLLRESSMVVFGGGSVFRAMGPLSEKRLFALHSSISGHPVAALGVSVGPFLSASQGRRLAQVLRRIEYISVRDQASARLLADIDYPARLVQAGDLAGLLPEALGDSLDEVRRSENLRPRLGVTLLGVDYEAGTAEFEQREQALISGIRMLAEKEPLDVTIFVFNTHAEHGDTESSKRLHAAIADLCEVRVVTPRDGVAATWAEMKRCDFGLHMRLHGAIFSFMADVPFLLVPYQRKCDDFLDEIGQPQTFRFSGVPQAAEAVFQKLANVLETGERPRVTRQEFAQRARWNLTRAPWAV
jgi:polysaccharide pyruvyl transferase WcaK-like protein